MSPGKAVNLIANDVNRFNMMLTNSNNIWGAPVSILTIGYILNKIGGVAALIGMAGLLLVIPLQGKILDKIWHAQLNCTCNILYLQCILAKCLQITDKKQLQKLTKESDYWMK